MTGRIGHGTAGLAAAYDVVVVGLGVTGAGVKVAVITLDLSTLRGRPGGF